MAIEVQFSYSFEPILIYVDLRFDHGGGMNKTVGALITPPPMTNCDKPGFGGPKIVNFRHGQF